MLYIRSSYASLLMPHCPVTVSFCLPLSLSVYPSPGICTCVPRKRRASKPHHERRRNSCFACTAITTAVHASRENKSVCVKMLLPPGIRNEGNICFASSILQCLLNQPFFIEGLEALRMQHMERCNQCCRGLLRTIQFFNSVR